MLPLEVSSAEFYGLLGTLGAAVIALAGVLVATKVGRTSTKEVNVNLGYDQIQEDREDARADAKEARADARQARIDATASREAAEKAYAAIEVFRVQNGNQSRYIAYLLRHIAEHKMTAPLSAEAYLESEGIVA